MKPPKFVDGYFKDVDSDDSNAIMTRFKPFVANILVPYLNQTILRKIPETREKFIKHTYTEAFPPDPKVEEKSWYIYNIGGRSEIQFNIGMDPQKVRLGVAFHMLPQKFGNPEAVRKALKEFRTAIRNKGKEFKDFVNNHDIELEWADDQNIGIMSKAQVWPFLLSKQPKLTWLFIGRFLRKGIDRHILEDPNALDQVMTNVFEGLWPYYESTQLWLHGITTQGRVKTIRRPGKAPHKISLKP